MSNKIKSEALRGLLENRQADILLALADLYGQAQPLHAENDQITDLLKAQEPEPVTRGSRKRVYKKRKDAGTRKNYACTICRQTGHRANNKTFHPKGK